MCVCVCACVRARAVTLMISILVCVCMLTCNCVMCASISIVLQVHGKGGMFIQHGIARQGGEEWMASCAAKLIQCEIHEHSHKNKSRKSALHRCACARSGVNELCQKNKLVTQCNNEPSEGRHAQSRARTPVPCRRATWVRPMWPFATEQTHILLPDPFQTVFESFLFFVITRSNSE